MSKWVVIVIESKNEDEEIIRRNFHEAGGQVVWIGDRRPLVIVRVPKSEEEES